MSEFIYQNTARIKGPILLDRFRLEELSETLNKEWARMEALWTARVEELAKAELQEYGHRYPQELEEDRLKAAREYIESRKYSAERVRYVVGELEGERSVKVQTLEELLRRPEIQENRLKSIRVEWRIIDVEFSLEIARFGDEVGIDVRPKQGETSRELFSVIRQWARAIEPSLSLKIWATIREPAIFVVGMCVLALLFYAMWTPLADKKPLVDKAETLLDKGIDQNEERAALELLLRLETGSYGTPPADKPNWPWIALTAATVGCLIAAIRPSTVIGVGPGEKSLDRWRIWGKLVWFSSPAFIVTSVLSYFISKIMDGLLS
ncbi:MAG: hypothetical protein H6840_00140 [Planctomycetes bacterium]|nr:hypothetical protein [Planctomycetota bacterium]